MTAPALRLVAEDVILAHGSHVAVRRSSFDLPATGVTAVIGPNGSGKSTLLHALAGLLPPVGGRAGVDRADGGPARVSYVMQSVDLPVGVPLTVAETVGMARYPSLGWWRRRTAADREAVARAMDLLDVTALAKRHLTELSGGQRQRVFVAQGIAQDHDVLMLDEPLTGLDIVSARTIDAIIHDRRDDGRAIVLTTHDLAEARAADHVVLMSGRVIAAGSPDEVLTRRHLEVAYGLGDLHHADEPFLDDPTDTSAHRR